MIRKIALASLNFITIESTFDRWTQFAPRYDWRDFDTDDYENISGDMTNARNVRMPDIESGTITSSTDQCGFYGCNDRYGVPYATNPFRASNALNGQPRNQGVAFQNFHNKGFYKFFANSVDDGQDSGMFKGYYSWTRTRDRLYDNAWVADIQNDPTVEFIKIWPGFQWHPQFYYSSMVGLRVFINEVECNPIEYYNMNRIREFLPWPTNDPNNPFSWDDPQADQTFADYGTEATYIFKCEGGVQNANSIRIKHDAGYLVFNEVEIFSKRSRCPTTETDACPYIDVVMFSQPNTCIANLPTLCNTGTCTEQQCKCTGSTYSGGSGGVITYNQAVCQCPDDYTGEFCEVYTGDLPCDDNPCNSDENNDHLCKDIISMSPDIPHSYRCYCRNGYSGSNCEIDPPCYGRSCSGSGDVHYSTFDSTPHDNQGFCQYVLTTNYGCSQSWPIDTDSIDWENFQYPVGQDFFLVVAEHSSIPEDPNYNREVSRLTGIQIYFRNQVGGLIYRITSGSDFDGWTLQGWLSGFGWSYVGCPSCAYTNAQGNYISNFNLETHGFALRISGSVSDIYIGAGMRGDTNWKSSYNSPVLDYLLKVRYERSVYGYVNVHASCELENSVCGICGNYDNNPDFGFNNNYSGYGDQRIWERSLERDHFWGMKRITSGDLVANGRAENDRCPFTNLDGNKVPIEELAQKHTGRKKRQASTDCPFSVY